MRGVKLDQKVKLTPLHSLLLFNHPVFHSPHSSYHSILFIHFASTIAPSTILAYSFTHSIYYAIQITHSIYHSIWLQLNLLQTHLASTRSLGFNSFSFNSLYSLALAFLWMEGMVIWIVHKKQMLLWTVSRLAFWPSGESWPISWEMFSQSATQDKSSV